MGLVMDVQSVRDRLNAQKKLAKTMYGLAWQLSKNTKSFLLIPVLSIIALLSTLFGLFYLPYSLLQYFSPKLLIELQQHAYYSTLGVISTVLGLVITYFLAIFALIACNAMIIICTKDIINNKRTSMYKAFKIICTRKLKIVQWSVFLGTIGLIINTLEFLSDTVTALLISFIGYSFYSLSWMILPIVIEQGLSPKEAINQAQEIMRSAFLGELIYMRSYYFDARLFIAQILFAWTFFFTFNHHFPEHYKMITAIVSLSGLFLLLLLQAVLLTVIRTMAYECTSNELFYSKIQHAANLGGDDTIRPQL